MKVEKFKKWVINELSSQSATAPIQNGGEPSFNYGNIQDILGNKYNFTVKTQKLKEFEENVIKKDKKGNVRDDEYFAKRFIEFQRNNWRLTPPFQNDLIQNNDFYARAFYDEQEDRMQSNNDTGKPIRGLQENIINEDGVACATGSAVSGMGAVVSSQPSSIPGNTSAATTGSGDIGSGWEQSKGLNRNIIARPTGSRRKNRMKAKAKEMVKGFANQFKGDEYKQGGDKNVANIMSFTDFSKKK
jgi:hypothetical protein